MRHINIFVCLGIRRSTFHALGFVWVYCLLVAGAGDLAAQCPNFSGVWESDPDLSPMAISQNGCELSGAFADQSGVTFIHQFDSHAGATGANLNIQRTDPQGCVNTMAATLTAVGARFLFMDILHTSGTCHVPAGTTRHIKWGRFPEEGVIENRGTQMLVEDGAYRAIPDPVTASALRLAMYYRPVPDEALALIPMGRDFPHIPSFLLQEASGATFAIENGRLRGIPNQATLTCQHWGQASRVSDGIIAAIKSGPDLQCSGIQPPPPPPPPNPVTTTYEFTNNRDEPLYPYYVLCVYANQSPVIACESYQYGNTVLAPRGGTWSMQVPPGKIGVVQMHTTPSPCYNLRTTTQPLGPVGANQPRTIPYPIN
jgi:hypothetical protein